MAEHEYKNLSLVAKHVPDSSVEIGPDGNKAVMELPGHVEIGVNVEGAFIPLAKIGTARLQKHIDNAAKAASDKKGSK